jgi:hypothetical protein
MSEKLKVDDLTEDQKHQLLNIAVQSVSEAMSDDCDPDAPMELFMVLADWGLENFPDKRNRR